MDGWTSLGKDAFITVTVHFIDADWNLHSECLGVHYTPDKHDA